MSVETGVAHDLVVADMGVALNHMGVKNTAVCVDCPRRLRRGLCASLAPDGAHHGHGPYPVVI